MKTKLSQLLAEKRALRPLCQSIFVLLTLCGSYFLLQFSLLNGRAVRTLFSYWFPGVYGLLGLLTIGAFLAVLLLLCRRLWLAGLLCSVISGAAAVANYYVLQFHSMPLSFLVLRNFKTAMNVISSYTFAVGKRVLCLLLGTAALAAMALVYRWLFDSGRKGKKFPWKRDLLLLAGCAAVLFVGYLGPDPIKPAKTLGWSWEEAYYQYGYPACTVESFFQMFNVVSKPDGYSQQELDAFCAEYSSGGEQKTATPDIILILNECFYDLRQITDPDTDLPFMENIDTMEGLLTGYAVVPGRGGGTNSAEYELLTGNSLQLMPGVTPFNTINLNGANSIVSHLNALGYHTLGSHSEPSLNYSRGAAYPALGFRTVYFEEAYRDVRFHGDRFYETDESLYQNLQRWYDEMPADTPRFQYLLTIQNHGAWDLSDPQYDLIHTNRDYGDNTQSVNEYLTGIHLTDLAFRQLTEYYASVDRPVIICMMGDHAPTFAAAIADQSYSGDELELRLRKTPLLIWANFPLEEQDLGTMSMNMVVPTLLNLAGVELSPYFRYMLELKEQAPVLTSYGVYYDREGNVYRYNADEGTPYEAMVDRYFALEYQNAATDRNREFYLPDGT